MCEISHNVIRGCVTSYIITGVNRTHMRDILLFERFGSHQTLSTRPLCDFFYDRVQGVWRRAAWSVHAAYMAPGAVHIIPIWRQMQRSSRIPPTLPLSAAWSFPNVVVADLNCHPSQYQTTWEIEVAVNVAIT